MDKTGKYGSDAGCSHSVRNVSPGRNRTIPPFFASCMDASFRRQVAFLRNAGIVVGMAFLPGEASRRDAGAAPSRRDGMSVETLSTRVISTGAHEGSLDCARDRLRGVEKSLPKRSAVQSSGCRTQGIPRLRSAPLGMTGNSEQCAGASQLEIRNEL